VAGMDGPDRDPGFPLVLQRISSRETPLPRIPATT